jgi:ATP-dependent RNA helicase DDX46/PRP5
MFSATFPKQMEALARKTLYKPIEVSVGGRSIVCKEVIQNVVSIKNQIKKKVSHFFFLSLFLMMIKNI